MAPLLSTAENTTAHFRSRIEHALSVLKQSLPENSILSPPPPDDVLDVTGIPASCGLLSAWELDITENYDATALVQLLATRKITAVALLDAFRKRASIAHQLTNCLTELVSEAREHAKEADAYIERTGKPLGPLHGLPISLKEQIGLAGQLTNAGFVAWIDNRTEQDANLITSLRALGAIVFARTSQPQSFMHLETSNNIYGVTINARNRRLTGGGSSGGETALLALNATPLGIGGDIGGSIRGPASLNGVWGFKPSVGRVSGLGVVVPWPGCDSIHGTLGSFTRSLRDVDLFHSAYSLSKPWLDDPDLLPYPVSIASACPIGKRKLRVGIMATDGVVTPLPPVQVVMEEVSKKLAAYDTVEVVPFEPLQHDEAWKIISANYFEDGGETIKKICAASGEELRPLTEWMIDECKKNEQLVGSTTQERRAARDDFRTLYCRHWNKANIDVVLAPVTPSVAQSLDTSRYWGYTAVWNLMDYPAISFPASVMIGGYPGKLSDVSYVPTNEIEEAMYTHYDPEVAQKMPVGLQIVSKKWMDSECLAAMQVIEQAMLA